MIQLFSRTTVVQNQLQVQLGSGGEISVCIPAHFYDGVEVKI